MYESTRYAIKSMEITCVRLECNRLEIIISKKALVISRPSIFIIGLFVETDLRPVEFKVGAEFVFVLIKRPSVLNRNNLCPDGILSHRFRLKNYK